MRFNSVANSSDTGLAFWIEVCVVVIFILSMFYKENTMNTQTAQNSISRMLREIEIDVENPPQRVRDLLSTSKINLERAKANLDKLNDLIE